eukprot:16040892-Heterocapsa_arctica.AAC.1
MASQVDTVFKGLAMKLGVPEPDFIVLLHEGIHNADEYFFRIPKSERVEAFLKDVVYPVQGVWQIDGSFGIEPRPGGDLPEAWRVWTRGKAAAGLRRLWE